MVYSHGQSYILILLEGPKCTVSRVICTHQHKKYPILKDRTFSHDEYSIKSPGEGKFVSSSRSVLGETRAVRGMTGSKSLLEQLLIEIPSEQSLDQRRTRNTRSHSNRSVLTVLSYFKQSPCKTSLQVREELFGYSQLQSVVVFGMATCYRPIQSNLFIVLQIQRPLRR